MGAYHFHKAKDFQYDYRLWMNYSALGGDPEFSWGSAIFEDPYGSLSVGTTDHGRVFTQKSSASHVTDKQPAFQ